MQPVTNPLFKERERRYRILRISPRLLFGGLMFSPLKKKDGKVQVFELEGLPDNTEIAAMVYDALYDRVELRLYNKEWDVLEPCDAIPYVDAQITAKEYTEVPMMGGILVPEGMKWEVEPTFLMPSCSEHLLAALKATFKQDQEYPLAAPEQEVKSQLRNICFCDARLTVDDMEHGPLVGSCRQQIEPVDFLGMGGMKELRWLEIEFDDVVLKQSGSYSSIHLSIPSVLRGTVKCSVVKNKEGKITLRSCSPYEFVPLVASFILDNQDRDSDIIENLVVKGKTIYS